MLKSLLNMLPRRAKLYKDKYENGMMWVCEFEGHYEYAKTPLLAVRKLLNWTSRSSAIPGEKK